MLSKQIWILCKGAQKEPSSKNNVVIKGWRWIPHVGSVGHLEVNSLTVTFKCNLNIALGKKRIKIKLVSHLDLRMVGYINCVVCELPLITFPPTQHTTNIFQSST